MSINEELLNVDPDSQAVEVSDDVQFDPNPTNQVVATEPPIISIGRGKRIEALRTMQDEQK
jgi:hypothetical protein